MKIHNLFCGGYASNCYFVTDDREENAVVIDPSVSPSDVSFPTKAKVQAILLTHTHYDHMLALDAWRATGAPVMVAANDAEGMHDSYRNASEMFHAPTVYTAADRLLYGGDRISFGDETLEVMLTPGHTSGSCCFRSGDVLFSGDTMFASGGFGRYDLPSADFRALFASLKALLKLDPATRVYPGHGEPTTIDAERRYHPVIE